MATGRGGGKSETAGGGASVVDLHSAVQTVEAEYDDEGVFFYQAFNGAIADWALANQRFGGPHFSTSRMFVTQNINFPAPHVRVVGRYIAAHKNAQVVKLTRDWMSKCSPCVSLSPAVYLRTKD
jgi:hypothetical protein